MINVTTDLNQLWRLSAGQLSELLVAGELSPVELLDETLKRIARVNPAINAIIALDEAGARAAARESEKRLKAGQPRSPLEGIPLTVKDHILVKDVLACWGE